MYFYTYFYTCLHATVCWDSRTSSSHQGLGCFLACPLICPHKAQEFSWPPPNILVPESALSLSKLSSNSAPSFPFSLSPFQIQQWHFTPIISTLTHLWPNPTYILLGEIIGNLNTIKRGKGWVLVLTESLQSSSFHHSWPCCDAWSRNKLKQADEEKRSGKEGVEYKGRQNKDALSLIANLQPLQEAPDTGQNPLNKHEVKSAVNPHSKYIEYAWRVNHQVCTEKLMVVLGLFEMPWYFSLRI